MSESILTTKMKENYRFFRWISIVYGLIFAFCFYENPGGASVFLYTAATVWISLFVLVKMEIRANMQLYICMGGMLLAGLNSVIRMSMFFRFFNVILVLFLWGAGMIGVVDDDRKWKFFTFIRNYIIFIASGIICIITPFTYRKKANGMDGEEKGKEESHRMSPALSVIIGLMMAFFFLMIVMPLLVASDRVFSMWFSSVVRLFYPDRLIAICFLVIFGFFFCHSFFAALFRKNRSDGTQSYIRLGRMIGIPFLTVVGSVYIVFSFIQIVYLFFRGGMLPSDLTYSAYAREGFWQLIFVALINLMTVLLYDLLFEKHRISDVILWIISCCTFIMIGSAGYRMILYIDTYGLTFLRVLVLWFLLVLFLVFIGVIIYIVKETFPVFKYMAAVVAGCYLLFSYVNVDAAIVKYNITFQADAKDGPDMYYMMYNLSLDAAPKLLSYDLEPYFSDGVEYEVWMSNYRQRIIDTPLTIRGWNYGVSRAWKALR